MAFRKRDNKLIVKKLYVIVFFLSLFNFFAALLLQEACKMHARVILLTMKIP